VSGDKFRVWLSDRVGDGPGKVSRRELSRRLAAQDPTNGDSEVYRRTVRRILDGSIGNPTPSTREAIEDALEDHSAPSAADDEEDELDMAAELLALARESFELNRRLSRVMRAVGS
jgi:hypothetical protein